MASKSDKQAIRELRAALASLLRQTAVPIDPLHPAFQAARQAASAAYHGTADNDTADTAA
jgi:hypothetical protein